MLKIVRNYRKAVRDRGLCGGAACGEISESLGQLVKVRKNSGEDPGLSREGRDPGTGIGGVHGLQSCDRAVA